MRVSLLCSLLALLSLSINVSATNYYFSSSTGRDSNTGTSPSSPWQTTDKFNSALSRMSAGDNVYFCKGDTWLYAHIAVTAQSSGVTIDSYTCRNGQNAKPILSVAVQPAGNQWRRVGNTNVLTATLDSVARDNGVQAIWVDNVRYITARFPALLNPSNTQTIGQTTWGLDGEFFRTNRLEGSTIYCNELTQGTDYWKGAQIYVRVLNYAYLPYTVIRSGPGFVTLHSPPGQAVGFYFSHTPSVAASNTHLRVKQAGEFTFDPATGVVTLHALSSTVASRILSGAQPVSVLYNNHPAAVVVNGGATSVTIRNLHVKWSPVGISTLTNGVVNINNNDISHVAGSGIHNQRMGTITIEHNYVFDAESTCISSQSVTRVSRNTVRQCGLYAGWGAWQATNGVTCAGGECSYNDVRHVGYIGISPTARAFVYMNTVDWAMMTLNDGGGIYGYGAGMTGVSVYSNVVTNVVGNYASWVPWPIAPCYYLDTTSFVQMFNNTCTAAPSCVQMNFGQGHVIFSNVCNAPGMYINQANSASTFMGNLVATTGTNTNWQNSLHRVQAPNRQSYNDIMTTADNIYCIPQGADRNYLFQMVKAGLNVRYNYFADWKDAVTPVAPAWERGTAVYTSCRGLRAGFSGNDMSTLPLELRPKKSTSTLVVSIAVPVSVIGAALLLIVVGVAWSRSRPSPAESALPHCERGEVEIELPQSSPTSGTASSFSLMASPSHSVCQV